MNPETGGNKPFEIQVSDGVVLRELTVADSEAMFSLIDGNREHLSQFRDKTAQNYPNLESVIERNTNQGSNEHRFGIWDEDTFVGFIKLTATEEEPIEIGYWLGSEYQGKGYMAMSVGALTSYAVTDLGHTKVIAKVHKENKASQKALIKNGYKIVGEDDGEPRGFLLEYISIQ